MSGIYVGAAFEDVATDEVIVVTRIEDGWVESKTLRQIESGSGGLWMRKPQFMYDIEDFYVPCDWDNFLIPILDSSK